MKKICCFLVLLGLTYCFFSCSPMDIEFNDPQDVEFLHDAFLHPDLNGELQDNDDLVKLFGEENINFGPVPPSWSHIINSDSICFKVNGLFYDTCIRYIFDPYNDNAIILSHADPPTYDASVNLHLFYHQDQCLFHHKMNTRDTYGNNYLMDMGSAYITGHDNQFTTYFKGKIEGNGNPTIVMLISGTLVFDTITTNGTQTVEFKGVKDYIFGKKILEYEYQPNQAYAPGTIEIKKHPGLSPCSEWDVQ